MNTRKVAYGLRATVVAATLVTLIALAGTWPATGQTVQIDQDDIGGVVTGPNGPEGGVWVIAETTDLPTRLVKIVVTDDLGRYVLPDLPAASYQVWVRGYGLIDSPKVTAGPGRVLDLTAVMAPNPRAAAQYYPSGYWYSMMQVPPASDFPGTGPDGNGIAARSQAEWLWRMKTGGGSCDGSCHQIGTKLTRELPQNLGPFATSYDAWERRTQSGQAGPNMVGTLAQMGQQRALQMFADWTDRIAAGEFPEAPPRPLGAERNLVVTIWDWADPQGYLHDEISTDKRYPTVNGYGKIYGAMELSKDYLPVLDPVANTTGRIPLTPRDPNTPPAQSPNMIHPWTQFGDEPIWNSQTSVHNPMFDENGRVWLTMVIRPEETPAWCREGSSHPSAQQYPVTRNGRQLGVYDPATGQVTTIDTCFGTHHLLFGDDPDNTLWFSGGNDVVGWFKSRQFDQTGDEQASQGWTPLILDTNGNGQQDAYVEPNDEVDPTMDKRIQQPFYGLGIAPGGIIWGSINAFPGGLVRLDPGQNPPETALAEYFEVPYNDPRVSEMVFSPRGMDVDGNGVVWTPLSSGHLASFDRRKCQGPLNGPTATGQHCPEGWSFYQEPIPQFRGVTDPGSTEASYYTWVDQHNTLGLGENIPINTGNASDGLLALNNGEWVVLRVPYPMGFFIKGLDGRIDDPIAGWKGRGLYTTIATRAPWHMETGPGTMSKVLHFQLRPDPLSK